MHSMLHIQLMGWDYIRPVRLVYKPYFFNQRTVFSLIINQPTVLSTLVYQLCEHDNQVVQLFHVRRCACEWSRAAEPRSWSWRDEASFLLAPIEWGCWRSLSLSRLILMACSTLELALLGRRDCRSLSFLLPRIDADDDVDDSHLDDLPAAAPPRWWPL